MITLALIVFLALKSCCTDPRVRISALLLVGLLLVTNDGDLSHALCAEGQCAKQYYAVVNRVECEQHLTRMLVDEGVSLGR